MRSIEILLVIIIMTGAFLSASFFAVLPEPRRVSPLNLRRLALTTLQALDVKHDISDIAFEVNNQTAWNQLQIALSASLPPNIIYNLTAYNLSSANGTPLYAACKSISNAESLGIGSDAASYLVASSNVTFNLNPQKIDATLYILNCSDANGWWTTGYTAQKLAEDLNNLLSPYFQTTIMVQNTTQLARILNEDPLQNEKLRDAVVINTFGEAVPIPINYTQNGNLASQGYEQYYDSDQEKTFNYTRYCYTLGKKTRQFNWTWASIVGYPFYYVSNTQNFTNDQNSYGIYGMQQVYRGGARAFLQGIDNQNYVYNSASIVNTALIIATLSTTAQYCCNYYGMYPSPTQSAVRSIDGSLLSSTYHLSYTVKIFDPVGKWFAGAVYRNVTNASGGFLALGLARTPDIRLTALGLLCYYQPQFYRTDHTTSGTSRLVVLQLGQVGGV